MNRLHADVRILVARSITRRVIPVATQGGSWGIVDLVVPPPGGGEKRMNTSKTSSATESESVRTELELLELRIHAHRITARELLEEGTPSGKKIAARLIRGADLLETDLMLIREQRRRVDGRA